MVCYPEQSYATRWPVATFASTHGSNVGQRQRRSMHQGKRVWWAATRFARFLTASVRPDYSAHPATHSREFQESSAPTRPICAYSIGGLRVLPARRSNRIFAIHAIACKTHVDPWTCVWLTDPAFRPMPSAQVQNHPTCPPWSRDERWLVANDPTISSQQPLRRPSRSGPSERRKAVPQSGRCIFACQFHLQPA